MRNNKTPYVLSKNDQIFLSLKLKCLQLSAYPLEASGGVEFTLHHVKEDGDGGFPQLRLWDQGHFQDRPHHLWDELDFMLTCRRKD